LKVIKVFKEYMKAEGHGINGADYMKNIEAKMKQFYETYRERKKLSPLVRELPWSHNGLKIPI